MYLVSIYGVLACLIVFHLCRCVCTWHWTLDSEWFCVFCFVFSNLLGFVCLLFFARFQFCMIDFALLVVCLWLRVVDLVCLCFLLDFQYITQILYVQFCMPGFGCWFWMFVFIYIVGFAFWSGHQCVCCLLVEFCTLHFVRLFWWVWETAQQMLHSWLFTFSLLCFFTETCYGCCLLFCLSVG